MSRIPGLDSARRAQPLDYAQGEISVAGFMNAVYAWMCVGLAVTAVVAWWTSTQPALMNSISGGVFLLLFLAEIVLVVVIGRAINALSTSAALGLFLLFSAINGLTLAGIFIVYDLGLIGLAFATTATMFGIMSVVGFVTKKDLSSLGGFLLMALIGLIIASIVNIFWANSTFDWIISYAGVAIFLGLTVYDTNMLKQIAYQTQGNPALATRLAVVGSLNLYLDFINLFLFILRILGRSRE